MAIALVLATLASGVAMATPANALPEDCLNGRNGFVDTPASVPDAKTARSVDLGSGVTIQLRYGTINGRQHGWARITGFYLSTDRLWMDWTVNSGASWIQCGPFSAGTRAFTPAQRTSFSATWRFRACGRLVPPNTTSKCTSWW